MRGVGIREAAVAAVLACAGAIAMSSPVLAAESGPVADACYAFTEDQLATYNNNSETIYYNLITAYGKAPVPANDSSSPAAPEKSRKKRRAKN